MKRRTGGKELVLNGWRNRIAKEDGENGEGLAKLREKSGPRNCDHKFEYIMQRQSSPLYGCILRG